MVVLWSLAARRRPTKIAVLSERGGDTARPRQRRWRKPAATELTGHAAPVRALAFSPDGTLLATGGNDDAVLVWDLTNPTSPRHVRTLPHKGAVTAVAFSPDGRLLATASERSSSLLWAVS